MLNSAGNFFPEDNRRIVWACKLPPSLGAQHYVPARRAGPGNVKHPVLLIDAVGRGVCNVTTLGQLADEAQQSQKMKQKTKKRGGRGRARIP